MTAAERCPLCQQTPPCRMVGDAPWCASVRGAIERGAVRFEGNALAFLPVDPAPLTTDPLDVVGPLDRLRARPWRPAREPSP